MRADRVQTEIIRADRGAGSERRIQKETVTEMIIISCLVKCVLNMHTRTARTINAFLGRVINRADARNCRDLSK